jgi:acyl carrier protein
VRESFSGAFEEPVMGIDVLDVIFQAERRFKVKVSTEALSELAVRRKPPDITAGEMLCLFRKSERYCPECEYDLRGHSPGARCPECGNFPSEISWRAVQEILADVSSVDIREIREDSLLFRELGLD